MLKSQDVANIYQLLRNSCTPFKYPYIVPFARTSLVEAFARGEFGPSCMNTMRTAAYLRQ
jgi:hypothetical protein